MITLSSRFWLNLVIVFALPIAAQARTVVLGFDGMDPKLAEQWMAEGVLPNFRKLAEQGHYQSLGTTNPPQSPVAWASFATGENPGQHGIFDFIHRDAEKYTPDFSISKVTPPDDFIELFGYQIPLEDGDVVNRRVGKPFWMTAEQQGVASSVLRVPVTYPPDRIHRMLSGMGVPDLLGTQGTFTMYASRFSEHASNGGQVVHIKPKKGRVEAEFKGPVHPLSPDKGALTVPLVLEDSGNSKVKVWLDDQEIVLQAGQWSDWIELNFRYAGVMSTSGMVRLHLVEAFPRPALYISPINIDPRDPAIAVSAPQEYAVELASRIGPYHTLGLPEETWSLNENRISDDAYLDMVATVLSEREAMFFDTLAQNDSELVVSVFVQTDRVSHMFWRGLDEQHPLHHATSPRGKQAVRWIYQEADRILGKTLSKLGDDDRLIVLSDHGFSHFRRMVHLNRWLIDHGYMRLMPGKQEAGVAFENVDWSKTQAYALGLNGLFLNLAGRESEGIVQPEAIDELTGELQQKLARLMDSQNGKTVIAQAYLADEIYQGPERANSPDLVIGYSEGYRASWQTVLGAAPKSLLEDNRENWSGDHCIAPNLVPGVLFTSFKLEQTPDNIVELSKLILKGLPNHSEKAAWRQASSVGLFDHANPLFDLIRKPFRSWLPPFLELLLWGLLGAYISMRLYKWLSNQEKLAELKPQLKAARKELAAYDDEFSGLWPLIGKNYRLAGRQLWLTFMPAVLSSIPLLFLLAWLSNQFDARMPERGDVIEIRAAASPGLEVSHLHWHGEGAKQIARGEWQIIWPAQGESLQLKEADDTELLNIPMPHAISVKHQPLWWNQLFGNPIGYLPAPGVIDRLEIDLPAVEVLSIGPNWLRTWYVPFFLGMVGFSLFFKFRWKLL